MSLRILSILPLLFFPWEVKGLYYSACVHFSILRVLWSRCFIVYYHFCLHSIGWRKSQSQIQIQWLGMYSHMTMDRDYPIVEIETSLLNQSMQLLFKKPNSFHSSIFLTPHIYSIRMSCWIFCQITHRIHTFSFYYPYPRYHHLLPGILESSNWSSHFFSYPLLINFPYCLAARLILKCKSACIVHSLKNDFLIHLELILNS